MQKKAAKKPRQWLVFVPYLTLLISVIYYIYSFSYSTDVKTFVPALLVWPFVVVFGVIFYLTRYCSRNFLLDVSAFFAAYTAVVTAFTSHSGMYDMLSALIYTILWFGLLIFFFHNTYQNGLTSAYLKWLWFVLPICVFVFVLQVDYNQTDVSIKTLNPIFYILYFLPFVLLEKKVPRYLGIVLVFVAILLSNKRTGLLAFLMIMVYLAIAGLKSSKLSVSKLLKRLFFVAVAILGLYFVYTVVLSQFTNVNWVDRFSNMFETGGAGRTDRWLQFFSDMHSANAFQVLFGHGNVYPYYHNDLMQVMYDYGIIGALSYSIMCTGLVFLAVKMSKQKYKYSTAFAASLIIFFFNSTVGQVIVVHTWFLQMATFWGLIIGDFYREERKKKYVVS